MQPRQKLCALLIFVFGAFCVSLSAQSSYSCGNGQSGHCYGETTWRQAGEYFGVWSDQWPARMECNSCGGFTTDEAWLVDDSDTCAKSHFRECWVEVGLYRSGGESNAHYFWADGRPSGSFNLHIMGDEKFDSTVYHYVILKDGRGGDGIYQVQVYDDSLQTFYAGTSKNNKMFPHRISIGEELAGKHGAWADFTLHTSNTWATQPMGNDWIYWGQPQTTLGSVQNSDPPLGAWWVQPDSGSNQGGAFATACCQHF